jgi:hypothetical protein
VPDLDTAQRRATTNVTLMPASGTGPGDGHGEYTKKSRSWPAERWRRASSDPPHRTPTHSWQSQRQVGRGNAGGDRVRTLDLRRGVFHVPFSHNRNGDRVAAHAACLSASPDSSAGLRWVTESGLCCGPRPPKSPRTPKRWLPGRASIFLETPRFRAGVEGTRRPASATFWKGRVHTALAALSLSRGKKGSSR